MHLTCTGAAFGSRLDRLLTERKSSLHFGAYMKHVACRIRDLLIYYLLGEQLTNSRFLECYLGLPVFIR